ncbi:arginine--tRNA ligase [Bryobacterales bacterium F-183]|nr:arginine--tRNA ligase [Bryobacterales bacterium F-183]
MFQTVENRVREAFGSHIQNQYATSVEIVIEEPKQASFGEMALPVAFQLAKALKKAPRQIATELAAGIGAIEGVASLEVAGNGYINIRLDRGAYANAILNGAAESSTLPGKIIVEHTNINPNKAAHIGHLRNAVLGDTFVRMLRATGNEVEVQNYIDNTGVQVADVIAGFHFLEHKTIDEVRALIDNPERPFDYVCWDLYARTSQHYDANPEIKAKWRGETLHAIEAGHGELSDLGHLVADAIVQCHIKTMLRLGVIYDVLPRESEILHLQFWATAFEQLKERKAIYFETEGKAKGCWVMPSTAFKDGASEEADDNKIIVRSNGTVTYVGKDIAYQLWKFGLLGKDFHYKKLLTYANGHELWQSTAEPQPDEKKFGSGREVYNVIDSRQSYLQDVVVAGLRALGYHDQADRSTHFAYEMVALSPRTCVELGIELSEEDKKKSHVEVSGRKGLGVKADDLIDKLIENAKREVDSRNAERSEAERLTVAQQIAIGALRYFMLKYTRNTVIAFDFQEALSFTGEAGPYVQYAAVRAAKIRGKVLDSGVAADPGQLDTASMSAFLSDEGLWQSLLAASKLEASLLRATQSGEPAHVAKYAFQLAQSFSGFYQDHRVLEEPDAKRQQFLLWMTDLYRRQFERSLDVLGIAAPEFM